MHVVGAVVRSHRSVMTSERRGEYSIREDFLKIGERRGEDSPLEALTPSVPADTRSWPPRNAQRAALQSHRPRALDTSTAVCPCRPPRSSLPRPRHAIMQSSSGMSGPRRWE
ncbi:hypothetical protein K466DRAFT_356254 [Polyporus arcularius HHB13444]|uniref:Uncharacterized protein n=1 Tax=Polyporus arcularius HHB13444 TaxID=1314778 RepID=A0A5C3PNQ1_9APHY|nr:hypothetical protein K466DRAFT_356254 [Polyporus arcularius HHB13444]